MKTLWRYLITIIFMCLWLFFSFSIYSEYRNTDLRIYLPNASSSVEYTCEEYYNLFPQRKSYDERSPWTKCESTKSVQVWNSLQGKIRFYVNAILYLLTMYAVLNLWYGLYQRSKWREYTKFTFWYFVVIILLVLYFVMTIWFFLHWMNPPSYPKV